MVIKRIGAFSCAKMAGTLYAILGVVFGAVISLIAIAGAFGTNDPEAALFPMFGGAAIVVLPLLYGCLGFLSALIGAWLYNVLAAWVGGIELDVQ